MITTWHGCEEARQGIRGTFSQLDDPVHYHEIPGIFMIVADPVGADIVDLTWEKIGQCFDADGVTVDSENGLQGALCGALKSGRTTLIGRSEEHTSELQSLMRISYAVFCLKKTKD